MTDDRLRVLIADDHPLFRERLRVLVESAETSASSVRRKQGSDAVAQTLDKRPDVVLMDLNMPHLGGVEATRRIVAAHPATRVLVLTMFEEDESVFAAMRAGARGYLLKGSGRDARRRSSKFARAAWAATRLRADQRAELNAEVERGRQIERGMDPEKEPLLEPRDRRKLKT